MDDVLKLDIPTLSPCKFFTASEVLILSFRLNHLQKLKHPYIKKYPYCTLFLLAPLLVTGLVINILEKIIEIIAKHITIAEKNFCFLTISL